EFPPIDCYYYIRCETRDARCGLNQGGQDWMDGDLIVDYFDDERIAFPPLRRDWDPDFFIDRAFQKSRAIVVAVTQHYEFLNCFRADDHSFFCNRESCFDLMQVIFRNFSYFFMCERSKHNYFIDSISELRRKYSFAFLQNFAFYNIQIFTLVQKS